MGVDNLGGDPCGIWQWRLDRLSVYCLLKIDSIESQFGSIRHFFLMWSKSGEFLTFKVNLVN